MLLYTQSPVSLATTSSAPSTSYSYMCPHTPTYVSSYSYICVLLLVHMCSNTPTNMCPHTAICVSSYWHMCVLLMLYMCPHTATYAVACLSRHLLLRTQHFPVHLPAPGRLPLDGNGLVFHGGHGGRRVQFTGFTTCFTSTKIACFTSTKVQKMTRWSVVFYGWLGGSMSVFVLFSV